MRATPRVVTVPQTRTCSTFASMTRTLSAPVTVAFDYTRSTGPVLGRFLTGLRDGVGRRRAVRRTARSSCRRPSSTRSPTQPTRRTSSRSPTPAPSRRWTWVPEPVKGQPFDRPFAFALVTLDGADVAAPARARRRRARRRRAPACGSGCAGATSASAHITDIACFEPELRPAKPSRPRRSARTRRPGHRDRRPGRARLPLRRLARGVARSTRSARRGQARRPALPDLPEGLHPAAQRLPGRRHADRGGGRAARTPAP